MTISTISNSVTSSVYLGNGTYADDLTITNTGSVIVGQTFAIYGTSAFTITNQGVVFSDQDGIDEYGAGTLINSGTVTGLQVGVDLEVGGTILNTGVITTGSAAGGTAIIADGGTIQNSDRIIGSVDGVQETTIASIANLSGTISGGVNGIVLNFGGSILNNGTISGGTDAVDSKRGAFTLSVDGGAVFDGAVVDGPGGGVLNLTGHNVGSLDMGNSFTGFSQINFGAPIWTLGGTGAELAAGQTISGFGADDEIKLENFAATHDTYVSGTGLVLSDGVDAPVTLDIQGSFQTSDFIVTTQSNVTSIKLDIPDVTIASTQSYTLASSTSLPAGTRIDFSGVGGTLTIEPAVFSKAGTGLGALGDFDPGDNLTIVNFESVGNNLGLPYVGSGPDEGIVDMFDGYSITLGTDGSFSSDDPKFAYYIFESYEYGPYITALEDEIIDVARDLFGSGSLPAPLIFSFSPGVPGGTLSPPTNVVISSTADINSTEAAICYLHGTRILTPTGPVAVEELRAGDAVVTRFGGTQRIKWLGRQNYAAPFVAHNPDKWPVCIKAGALEDGVPARDLYVSPGHAMLLGETLVLASRLINGITITRTQPVHDVNYVQIDLGRHDCVIAEGAWAETYADAPGQRAQFHNAAEYDSLYPDEPPAAALHLCAERPERGPRLAAVLLPVVARAASATPAGTLEGWIDITEAWRIEGWARDLGAPELPVRLDILVGEQVIGTVLACDFREDLRQAGIGRGHCGFSFTPPFRLRAEALANLVIRRAVDGAALPKAVRLEAPCETDRLGVAQAA